MTQTFYTLHAIKQPIKHIHRKHLTTLIDYLRKYHEDSNGDLPSAEGYLDMVRNAVENTILPME